MIKFRAWDKEKKIMDIVDGIHFDEDKIWEISCHRVCWRSIRYYILMQSTGLHDKNGVEIFEGDIIQNSGEKYEVKYDLERAGWYPFATDDGCGCCAWEVAGAKYSEVIGNVYEYPELLKK